MNGLKCVLCTNISSVHPCVHLSQIWGNSLKVIVHGTAWKQNASGPGCHQSGGSCTTTIKTPKTPHLSLSMREYFLAASHQQSWETFRSYAKECCRCYWGSQCPNTFIKYFPLICNPSRHYENQCQDIFNLISQHQYCIDISPGSLIRGNDDEWQRRNAWMYRKMNKGLRWVREEQSSTEGSGWK